MINYNKKSQSKGAIYYERTNILQYFGQKNKIDLFGYGWDKHENKNIRAINQGPIESKIDTLKQYKYSIAFENVNNENGYICEKIFDSFSAYSVPIFYGAPNVKELIPQDTFIDYRDFENLNELNAYLNSIDEKKYNEYMFAIKQFMESDEYLKFTSKGFVESINKAIAYVSNKPSVKKSIYSIKWEFFKKIFRYPKLFWNAKRFSFELLFKW